MAKKMNKGDDNKSFNNIQTCVLKVNLHCDGCRKKVKKLLHKIDGVYTTDIVADQGKVTVVGCVDSATLLKKLNKAGKHAVEWPTKGGNQKNFTNQLQMFQLDSPKDQHKKDNGKPQKGGGGGGKDKDKDKDLKGGQQKHQHLEEPQGKGIKDMFPNVKDFKFPFKNNNEKSGKFDVGSEDEDLDGDFGDELSDEFDDEEDDILGDMLGSDDDEDDDEDDDILGDPKLVKAMNDMAMLNDKKGSGGGGGGGGGGGHGKKGDQVHVANNSKGGGGKNGGGVDIDGKSGGKKKGGNGHDSKKGKNEAGQPKMGHGVPGMNPGQMGNMNQMGQFPTVQGLPAGANGMPVGYNGGFMPQDMMPAGAAVGNLNPYQQQQYMQAMLQQQQQKMLMNGQGHYPMPMGDGYGYARPMYYGSNVPSSYSMFSDEDPNGCSIM